MRSDLTALDWIAVVAALFFSSALFLFPVVVAPAFARMFQELGGELPWATRLVLAGWPTPLFGLVPVGLVGVALFQRRWSLGRARLLTVLAFLTALAGGAAAFAALYLPIFALAGNIR